MTADVLFRAEAATRPELTRELTLAIDLNDGASAVIGTPEGSRVLLNLMGMCVPESAFVRPRFAEVVRAAGDRPDTSLRILLENGRSPEEALRLGVLLGRRVALETHHLGVRVHLDPHRDDGGLHFFHDVAEAGGTLCILGGAGRRDHGQAGLIDAETHHQPGGAQVGDGCEQDELARGQNAPFADWDHDNRVSNCVDGTTLVRHAC